VLMAESPFWWTLHNRLLVKIRSSQRQEALAPTARSLTKGTLCLQAVVFLALLH
jgi:hypothetical protein